MKPAERLVSAEGVVRGHDTDPDVGHTSWSISQLAFGLAHRPDLMVSKRPLYKLTAQLLAMQAPDGGWPIRAGEEPSITLTFYPALALNKLVKRGLVRNRQTVGALGRGADFLRSVLDADPTTEERILGLRALQLLSPTAVDAVELDDVLARSYRARTLALSDFTVSRYRQPQWHSIIWHPLLYACTRAWAPIEHPVNALLGARLLRGYHADLTAWTGPHRQSEPHTGVSWASALALRNVVALADDLMAAGMGVTEYRARVSRLETEEFDFDVVVSFAGRDRLVAERVVDILKSSGLRVFYDRDYQHRLLGEELSEILHRTYFSMSRYAVVILSKAFIDSRWAGNWEWKAVLARMQQEKRGYVLPYFVEDVVVPGLNPTLGFISSTDYSPEQFARLVVRKLRDEL